MSLDLPQRPEPSSARSFLPLRANRRSPPKPLAVADRWHTTAPLTRAHPQGYTSTPGGCRTSRSRASKSSLSSIRSPIARPSRASCVSATFSASCSTNCQLSTVNCAFSSNHFSSSSSCHQLSSASRMGTMEASRPRVDSEDHRRRLALQRSLSGKGVERVSSSMHASRNQVIAFLSQ